MASTSGGRRVYDPLLRGLHWWMVACILGLILTSQIAEGFEDSAADPIWRWHILVGYGLAAGLAARVLWGLVGPEPARWSDLWHPAAWAGLLKLHKPQPRVGHDALASLGYLALYGLVAMMVVSGLGLAATEFSTGPLAGVLGGAGWLEEVLEEPHEAGFALILGFIGLHLAALFYHQWRGERVAQSMLTGIQYGQSPERDHV